MGSHKIIFGGGDQSLIFSPFKRVTSADYIIEDFVTYSSGSSDRLVASGSAIINGADTTISVAAGPNTVDPRKLVVVANTDLTASHRYVITDIDTGEYETFTIDSIQGTTVKTEVPMLHKYPALSTVQGLELLATFPAETAGDEDFLNRNEPLRVVWKYTIDGQLTHNQDLIRIVHHNRSDVSIDSVVEEIQTSWGGFGVRFEDGRHLRSMVEFCIRDVERVILSRGLEPEKFLMGSQGFHMVYWRTLNHMAMLGNHPPNVDSEIFKEDARREYEAALSSLTIGYPGAETKKTDNQFDQGTSKGRVVYQNIIKKA